MKQMSEIRTVDLVRGIRDAQAIQLGGKSRIEIIDFFNRAGKRAEKARRSSKPVSAPTRRITPMRTPQIKNQKSPQR